MRHVVDLSLAIGDSDPPRHAALADLATRQHGVVAHWQLAEIGFGPNAIWRLAERGRLHRLYVGVYAVGHLALSRHARWMAAVLACGSDALLSHRDGAAIRGVRPSSRATIDVLVPGERPAGQRGITVHRTRSLHPADRTVVDGIPVTSLARTLLDLAEVVPVRQLIRAIEEAERMRIFDLGAVEELMARSHGRHGLRAMRLALAETREHIPNSRNEFERLLIDVCRDNDLPIPRLNVYVNGREVDALWAQQKVIGELDSRGFHDNRAAFETDRIKLAELQLAGYRVIPITYRRLTQQTSEVVDVLRRALT